MATHIKRDDIFSLGYIGFDAAPLFYTRIIDVVRLHFLSMFVVLSGKHLMRCIILFLLRFPTRSHLQIVAGQADTIEHRVKLSRVGV